MKTVRIAAACIAVSFAAHAAFTKWYETGWARISSPILFLVFAYVFLSLAKRKPWTLKPAICAAMATTVLHLAFFPTPKYFGEVTWLAKCFAVVDISIGAYLWFVLSKASTQAWLLDSEHS